MKNFKIILLVFLTTCMTFSCGENDSDDSEGDSGLSKEGGPFELSELAGNWEANLAIFTRTSDNLEEAIVGDGGSVSLTVQSNDKCTFTINPVDCEAYTESGELFWEFNSENGEYYLAIVWDDFPDDGGTSFYVILFNNTFSMSCFEDCAEYDFNCDGSPETAFLNFNFIKK